MKKFYLTTQILRKKYLEGCPPSFNPVCLPTYATLLLLIIIMNIDELISLKFVYKTKVKEKYLHKKKKNELKKNLYT